MIPLLLLHRLLQYPFDGLQYALWRDTANTVRFGKQPRFGIPLFSNHDVVFAARSPDSRVTRTENIQRGAMHGLSDMRRSRINSDEQIRFLQKRASSCKVSVPATTCTRLFPIDRAMTSKPCASFFPPIRYTLRFFAASASAKNSRRKPLTVSSLRFRRSCLPNGQIAIYSHASNASFSAFCAKERFALSGGSHTRLKLRVAKPSGTSTPK